MDIRFFLPFRYDSETKRFQAEMYTNVAQNVFLNIESEESVADTLTQLQNDIKGGLSFWSTSTQISTTTNGTTTAVNPEAQTGRTIKIGDLIISSHADSSGYYGRITEVESQTSVTVTTIGAFNAATVGGKTVDEIVAGANALPVGTIIQYDGITPPPGFLPYGNGAILGRATYPDLWAFVQEQERVIPETEWQALKATQTSVGYYSDGNGSTTFRMPYTVDFFRPSSMGREPGSYQGDAIRNFTGTLMIPTNQLHSAIIGGDEALFYGTASPITPGGVDTTVLRDSVNINFDPSRIVPTADENRPKNIATLYCIKAFDATINQGLIDLGQIPQDIAELSGRLENLALKNLWISGEYTPVLNTPTIVTHGISGLDPLKAKCDVLLKCVSSEHGYSAGDFALSAIQQHASSHYGSFVPALHTTILQLNTGSTGIVIIQKSTGGMVAATLSNWRYIFRIWY